jgi:hypothetical protein
MKTEKIRVVNLLFFVTPRGIKPATVPGEDMFDALRLFSILDPLLKKIEPEFLRATGWDKKDEFEELVENWLDGDDSNEKD